jgi:hypothetical protein
LFGCLAILAAFVHFSQRGFIYLFFTCIGKEKYHYVHTLVLFIEKKGIFLIFLSEGAIIAVGALSATCCSSDCCSQGVAKVSRLLFPERCQGIQIVVR